MTRAIYMQQAVHLARRARGSCAPAPAVGCVLVREGEIVGRGWTQKGGRPHAEAMALAAAGDNARGASAFVSLEPCAHRGKPHRGKNGKGGKKSMSCADALVRAGVARLVFGVRDPDPRTNGKGAAKLRRAGVQVVEARAGACARAHHRDFILRLREGRPFITLKLATSADGVSVPPRRGGWLTGTLARRAGHLLRAEHDAIVIGRRTAARDDPRLDCRLAGLEDRSPQAVVLDSDLRLPASLKVMRRALVYHKQGARNKAPIKKYPLPHDRNGLDVRALAADLARRGYNRVLVEGGARLVRSFLRADLADELAWFRSPKSLGDGRARSVVNLFPPGRGHHWRRERGGERGGAGGAPYGDDELRLYARV